MIECTQCGEVFADGTTQCYHCGENVDGSGWDDFPPDTRFCTECDGPISYDTPQRVGRQWCSACYHFEGRRSEFENYHMLHAPVYAHRLARCAGDELLF